MVKYYVYLRVSTDKQDVESQMEGVKKKLKELGIPLDNVEIVKDEGISGGIPALQRDGFKYLYSKLEQGDVLILSELSRLGRSLSDVIITLDKLITEKGVRIISSKEDIDSHKDALQFKIMTTLISLFADLEREFIRKRTKEGLQRAREQGVKLGRPRKINYKLVLKLWEEGKSIKEISDITGYPYSSVGTIIHRGKQKGVLIDKPNRQVKWEFIQ